MRIINCEQGTPEWHEARRGMPTASRFADIITTKGSRSKSRNKYIYQLAGEIISGQIDDTYQSYAMLRGIEMEAQARRAYEVITDTRVVKSGFCLYDDSGLGGCSPDGMIGNNGLIEIKCPLASTHIEYLIEGVLPLDYYQQVHGSLFVTGREWCDFMSYYPGIKPFILRVEPDIEFISRLKEELACFNDDLKKLLTELRG